MLILITNDDGYAAPGINALSSVAREFGQVVVVAPERNASGKSMSLTSERPVRASLVSQHDGLSVFSCDGTPVDCVKLGAEYLCPTPPDLILSGINHGSNASINVLYSGTMGAALEATVNGFQAVGFSLLNHRPDADFSACLPYVRRIIAQVIQSPLPHGVTLNVNFPRLDADAIRGVRICREARSCWTDSFERRVDPVGRPYWWLTGKFVVQDDATDTDEWALAHGFVSIVPTTVDYTAHSLIPQFSTLFDTHE